MGYHPRIEVSDIASFSTIRTRNSELWLINNEKLENAILGNLAKFATRHKVKLFGFAMEGKAFVAWYFNIYFDYKDASKRYRLGEKNVKFPPGTYKPPIFTKKYSFKAAA